MGIFAWKHENGAVYDPTRKQFRLSYSKFKFKGIADIIGILPTGKLIAIECKSKTGRLTEDQKAFGERIQKWGGYWMCARCIKDVQEFLTEKGCLVN